MQNNQPPIIHNRFGPPQHRNTFQQRGGGAVYPPSSSTSGATPGNTHAGYPQQQGYLQGNQGYPAHQQHAYPPHQHTFPPQQGAGNVFPPPPPHGHVYPPPSGGPAYSQTFAPPTHFHQAGEHQHDGNGYPQQGGYAAPQEYYQQEGGSSGGHQDITPTESESITQPAPMSPEPTTSSPDPYLLTGDTVEVVPGDENVAPQGAEAKLREMFPNVLSDELSKLLKANHNDLQATIDQLVEQLIVMASMKPESAAYKKQDLVAPAAGVQESYYVYQENPLAPKAHTPHAAPYVAPVNTTVKPTGRKKALIIGINYEGSQYALGGCRADAKKIKSLLTQVYGFSDNPSNLIFMTDSRGADSRLTPTRRNIIKGFRWLTHNAQPGDVLFFHYSGHGSQQPDMSGTEVDGMDETILPVDWQTAGMISDDEISENLVQCLPSGVKLVSIMDCCHSGSGMDLPYTLDLRSGQWRSARTINAAAADVILISGCQDSETAADVNMSSYGGAGGALTIALVATLAANPYKTNLIGLVQQMTRFIKSKGLSQRPNLSSSQKFPADQVCFGFTQIYHNANPVTGHTKSNRPPPQYQPGDIIKQLIGGAARMLAQAAQNRA